MPDVDPPDNLKDFLQECTRLIKKKYPNASSSQIAKKFNLTQSTYSRVENGYYEFPNFNTAIRIARAACGEEQVQDFVNRFFPEMSITLKKNYSENYHVPFLSEKAETCFEDASTYELMLLANTHRGITKDDVKEQFGTRGLNVLEKLVEKEILKVNGEKVFLEGPINAGQETVHKLLQKLITSHYDVDAFGEKPNWLTIQYQALDREKALPRIADVMKNTFQEIRKIHQECKGDDLVWVGLVSDTLFKDSEFNKTDYTKEFVQ